jgi:hypothetical protein
MFFIPIYFQVTKDASPVEAGAYMIPSVVGNTIGGLYTGFYVKRYTGFQVHSNLSSNFIIGPAGINDN